MSKRSYAVMRALNLPANAPQLNDVEEEPAPGNPEAAGIVAPDLLPEGEELLRCLSKHAKYIERKDNSPESLDQNIKVVLHLLRHLPKHLKYLLDAKNKNK
jgi:hypothetical protein